MDGPRYIGAASLVGFGFGVISEHIASEQLRLSKEEAAKSVTYMSIPLLLGDYWESQHIGVGPEIFYDDVSFFLGYLAGRYIVHKYNEPEYGVGEEVERVYDEVGLDVNELLEE